VMFMPSLFRNGQRSRFWTFSKWWLMVVVIFWVMVYKLSQQALHLPEFVYVNF
jgi:hypothetical protein